MIFYTYIPTPIGRILYARKDKLPYRVLLPSGGRDPSPDPSWKADEETTGPKAAELAAYFKGETKTISCTGLPEGTPFQQRIWNATLQIPYGRTVSYEDVARAAGNPKACRAAGAALGANPLPVIIPCHRVIAKSGSLGGFSSGLEIKSYLIHLEQYHSNPASFSSSSHSFR
ncbi:MAG: methylated-DNA--[protein]-cysteine S-methyltransferase [Desulfarculaceae bacterium]|nr:methylated-DNA--[protein]-cysteine S-methyltransferase [Desulfarculaceae bacterium]